MADHNDRLWRNILPKPAERGSITASFAPKIAPASTSPPESDSRTSTVPATAANSAMASLLSSSAATSRGGGSHTLVACTACRKRKSKVLDSRKIPGVSLTNGVSINSVMGNARPVPRVITREQFAIMSRRKKRVTYPP